MERGSCSQFFFAGSGRRGASRSALLLFLLTAARAVAAPAAPGPESAATLNYTVLPGDNCGHIAKRLYGDSHRVDLIHLHNNLGPLPHRLRPGLVLRLPVSATAGSREPDARLTFVRNQVEAYTPDYHRGQKNEALAEGNRVGTLAASSAEISFVDETRMQLGEHSMVVIFGDDAAASGRHRRAAGSQEATLLRGTLRANLAELVGPGPAPPRKPITLTTPAARVELPVHGSEVHVDVDPQSTTRLSVLRGRSQLAAAGQRVQVPAGFGSRANKGSPPTPPRPLPGAPQWTAPLSAVLLSRGGPQSVVLGYRPSGGPPAALWHRQLARDASFNDLIEDSRVPAAELTWTLRELPAGELFVRISAIDEDRFEGPAAPVLKTRVAPVLVSPGGVGELTAVQLPPDLLCGLDGEPLHPGGRVKLAAARAHTVRCAATTAPEQAAELLIPAADSGPVLAQPEHGQTRWTATHGERDFSFRLVDGAGAPLALPVAELRLDTAAGVSATPLGAGEPGEYKTHLRWPIAVADLGLAVQLQGVQLAAIPLVPDPRESEPPPEVPPVLLAPPRLQPVPAAAPRIWLDVGAAGLALFNQGSYGLGGGLELGPRVRLPFGSLGIAVRLSVEQHLQPEPAPLLLNVGGALTYFIARPAWRVSPYLGLLAQGLFPRAPALPLGTPPPPTTRGLALGGLVGAQVRLGIGGLFGELGYRGAVYQQQPIDSPVWNTFFLLLGYRVSTN